MLVGAIGVALSPELRGNGPHLVEGTSSTSF